ncbi:DGCR6 [Cordylochernes scorpioides]|uniref:DGCR6 n=1 Tax=Cordylochernes scorpioides TaxID=51811 RepID=A0ABY6KF14_9ARAC|nr:DGCR6 [Cordylochernes scorpioides]
MALSPVSDLKLVWESLTAVVLFPGANVCKYTFILGLGDTHPRTLRIYYLVDVDHRAYQQRLPNELLSNLANSLLDNTVFEIVRGLREIQLMTESQLFERHQKSFNAQQAKQKKLMKKHQETLGQNPPPTLKSQLDKELEQELDKQNQDFLTKVDMKIVMELDQVVSDQQVVLAKAGVPGFHVTNNPKEIRLQMYLLDFIQRLSAEAAETT